MTTKIKMLLVDADEEMRRAVTAAVSDSADLALVGATDDGDQVAELVRRLQPEKEDRWASPLYRIYLNLNLGEEFVEIDRILNAQKK
jgi:chemotaxis response regulator CheB